MRKSNLSVRNKTIVKNEKKLNLYESQALKTLQRRFQVLVQDSHEVFEIINSDGTIQYISPAVQKILGYQPEERIGKLAYGLLEPTEKYKFIQMMDVVFNHPNQVVQEEIKIKTKTGQEITLACDMRNELSEPSVQGVILNWRVSSSHCSREDSSNASETIDELTRLPNRAAFESLLDQQMAEAKKGQILALMIVDIDRFKYINSYLGYEHGDQLLAQISQRLRLVLTDKVFLCRFSGDQYALMVTQGNKRDDYTYLAEEILRLFDSPFIVNDHKLDVSVSLGISIYPHDAQDSETLIKFAYTALLRGKTAGKKRCQCYSADVDHKNCREFLLRSDMQKALAEGQFVVHYQPMVNLHTNEVLAVEALLRWEHPICGMVSPAEFIPIMEETGFIVDVGKWLVEEVCRCHRQWKKEGLPPLKVSINCSSVQFAEESFVESIQAILHKMGFDPRHLIIEITESVLIENAKKVISDLQKLQEIGIMVAVDDFGTGFSSLSYLLTFNIDIIKIDGSFIQNIPTNKTSTIITHSVVNLARELNIKLVAEGIESLEQLSYLKRFKCHTGQGYLYSKPIPQHKLIEVIANKKCEPKKTQRF
ncbi:GGDEF domain-containing phosphodiesterase [Desulfitobacterium sp. PCE1]|uniref:sensor domain-containing protein n=1 Tax=Desulfitobacterium sp. PCE1 TaxID=146907 RepID=UPI00037EFB91|nr:GGDEF domain-containing phosphodiesterase [Desulfitobacterium sp. PCE1]